jgi:hypothetical protein
MGRPTKPAAQHMLALVHLTKGYKSFGNTGDFTTAANLAKAVINDYGLSLDSDPVARYNHDNEHILKFYGRFSLTKILCLHRLEMKHICISGRGMKFTMMV